MSSRTAVSTLVVGMFLTGCANSLLTKYQDKQCVENCDAESQAARADFEHPVWQTLNMFLGEFGCVILLLWKYRNSPTKTPRPEASMFTRILARASLRTGAATAPAGYQHVGNDEESEDENNVEREMEEEDQEDDNTLKGWAMCLMWFPAFFDICGTTLMNVGLILTPVSIYQMSRGALVLWVGVLSVIFLRRSLWLYQWTALIIVTMGVCLVGLSGSLVKKAIDMNDPQPIIEQLQRISKRAEEDPAKIALGVMLILFAQIFTASQYVVEEKIMSRYQVEPLMAVSLEGFFGLVTTLLSMPFLHFFLRHRSSYFDITTGWNQIINNHILLWTSLASALSIGAFNFFGLSVTSRVSATTRSTIDTCRTLGIWIVSLALGWEHLVYPFSLLQVAGFAMLVYGTFVFNGIVKPVCFPPPPSVHLLHEEFLEETGELPAAEGHVGYDV
ncbi:hypothetical protein BCR39DRAFT_562449 [Naematelia encephala]|uniref:Integral membrane protein n=1 Tax=Naematelia encephala TaxID=71784 RepID=A0A1Y2AHG8_9TREE|nr:hypothetical protein BCR39DRAFT_562449 [Naematelia encephala]